MVKPSDGYVRAIARGFSVVEALGQQPGRHTLSEAAAIAGLTRATARRMLATLVTLKYCETDGRYFRLRPRSLALGMSYLNALPYWAYSHRALEALRDEVKESCALAVLDEDEIVYLQRWPARRILTANLGVGSRLPAHVVSLGRMLLATLPADARADYLLRSQRRKVTPRTIIDAEPLAAALDHVAAQDYAWIDGELDPTICGLAVPVRNQSGSVIAAISVNTISGTVDEAAARARFLLPLQRTAQGIRAQTSAIF